VALAQVLSGTIHCPLLGVASLTRPTSLVAVAHALSGTIHCPVFEWLYCLDYLEAFGNAFVRKIEFEA
jgi:hypothetical protein